MVLQQPFSFSLMSDSMMFSTNVGIVLAFLMSVMKYPSIPLTPLHGLHHDRFLRHSSAVALQVFFAFICLAMAETRHDGAEWISFF